MPSNRISHRKSFIPKIIFAVCLLFQLQKIQAQNLAIPCPCGVIVIAPANCPPVPTFYRDADGDGYGNPAITTPCTMPDGYVTNANDCDDSDVTIYPGAPELCDGKDNDCNGIIEDGVIFSTWYLDGDGDGFGDPDISISKSCDVPADYVKDNTDCDDSDPLISGPVTYFKDFDTDGYGDPNTSLKSCSQPTGYVTNADDCNDQDNNVNIITWVLDTDNDGYYIGDPIVQCASPGIGYVIQTNQPYGDCNDNAASNGTVVFVNKNAVGPVHDGSSWEKAYKNLQDALSNINGCTNQIWVAAGVYYPDEGGGKTNNDRNATFSMKNNIAIYGGFSGTETLLNQRDWKLNKTILSGDIDQNDGPDFINNSGNSFHVFFNYFIDNNSILDGFTITSGNATAFNIFYGGTGGGMLNINSALLITNCIFTNNSAFDGGAISEDGSVTIFTNCIFTGNKVVQRDPLKPSYVAGGAMLLDDGNTTVINCIFSSNFASGGSAIYTSSFVTRNNLSIINSTFSNNGDNAIRVDETTLSIANSIFWGNSEIDILEYGSDVDVTYSIFQDGFTGTGNLDTDPLFVDAENNNFRLKTGSPVINSGNNAVNNEESDLDGNPRKVGVIDMGAYEAPIPCSPVSIDETGLIPLTRPGCSESAIANFTHPYSTTEATITLAQFITLGGGITAGSCALASITYTDNLDVQNSMPGSLIIYRTYKATDINGNSDEAIQQLTIQDNTPPIVKAKNITVNLQASGRESITANDVNNGSSDACGIKTLVLSKTDFDCSNVGNNLITLTVTDNNGNSSSASVNVMVVDTEKPTLSETPTIRANNDPGSCYKEISLTAPAAYDNCHIASGVSLTRAPANNKFPVGTTTVVWVVTDINGNSTAQPQDIIITDNEKPTLSPTTEITGNNDPGYCYKVINLTAPTPSDNCGISAAGVIASGVPEGNKFPVGRTTVTWSVTDLNSNTFTQTQDIVIKDRENPSLSATPVLTFNNDAGYCYKEINLTAPMAYDNCGILSEVALLGDVPIDNKFPVGRSLVIWTVHDIYGNSTTQPQVIVITDNEKPTLSATHEIKANNDPGFCYKVISLTAPTANDNCGISAGGVTVSGVPVDNKFPIGKTIITWSVTDVNNNTTTQTQDIEITDNEKAEITKISANPSSLWPPNHKMKMVTVDIEAKDNCGIPSCKIISVSSNEPDDAGNEDDLQNDWIITSDNTVSLRSERWGSGNGRTYTITVACNDASNNITTATTEVVVAHNITAPASGKDFKIGSTVSLAGTFWDVPGNKHTARWIIDGNTIAGKVTAEPVGLKNGTVTGSYKFNTAGVYKLRMEITDQHGNISYANTNGDLDAIVVIYDPNGGYTFGGGSFKSPEGSVSSAPLAKGSVSYGFQSNYFKTSTNPRGETNLDFKAGDFEFNAVNFEYLVITGAKAQFRGLGKLTNGQSGISFIMTVIDGSLDGSSLDKIRMKIFNKNTGEVFYDNEPGKSDADDPASVVKNGSTVVIVNGADKKRAEIFQTESILEVQDKFDVVASPNPSENYFSMTVQSSNTEDRISVNVIDVLGRMVEQIPNVVPGQTIQFGQDYIAGIYFIIVQQGKNKKSVKLIRQ